MLRREFLAAGAAFGLSATVARAAEPVMIEVRDAGLAGRYFAVPGARNRPAVLMLGGSNGGFPSDHYARDLAAAGFPTLTLAYFKGFLPGAPAHLPAMLEEIPLEYFFKAIDWLKARPEVNPRKVALMGESRGGELVLQLASMRPDVAGVIAYVPSHLRWGSVSPANKAAWTLGGEPLPYVRDEYVQGEPMMDGFLRALNGPPEALQAAAIPVEDIRGAVLLLTTTADGLWPSTRMAQAVMQRMAEKGKRGPRDHISYDDASHLLMGPGPGITRFTSGPFTIDFGGSQDGTRKARDAAWAAAKAFLGRL